MSDTTEQRGWEIEDSYQQHELDDPYTDVATSLVEGRSWLIGGLLVFLVTGVFCLYGMKLWLTPPTIVFKSPSPVIVSYESQGIWGMVTSEWRLSCLYFNGGEKIVRPNYDSPYCTAEAAKKRGEL